MKKIFILFALLTLHTVDGMAVTINNMCTAVDCDSVGFFIPQPTGCGTNYTKKCYKASSGHIMGFADCSSCINSAWERTSVQTTCGSMIMTYYKCCQQCTNCTSDTTWRVATTAQGLLKNSHQQKTTRTCNCGTCEESTQYRCAAGYWGNPTSISDTCERCPKNDGVYGTNIAGSNTTITSCYIKAGASMNDDGGTYNFTTDCPYTN